MKTPTLQFAALLLAFLTSAAIAADTQPAPHLVVGKDTTLITSPLNPDGTPDYLTYLNTKLSQGVTKENNAAIPLLKALGPKSIVEPKIRQLMLKAFDLNLPDDGPYLVQFFQFALESKDEFPKDPSARTPDMDPASNAFDLAAKTPWTASKYPLLAKCLAANDDPLKQITAASKLPRLYAPLISAKNPPSFLDATTEFPLGAVRIVGSTFACRAMLRLAGNDIAGAQADILTIRRLARLEAQQPFFIHNLVAVAMDKTAATAELAVLRSPNLTADGAKQIMGDLSPLTELGSDDSAVDEGEHIFLLNVLMPATQGNAASVIDVFDVWSGPDFLKSPPTPRNDLNQVDWNIALRAVNRRVEVGDAAENLPFAKDRHAALEPLIKEQDAAGLPTPPFDLFSSVLTPPTEEERKTKSEAYVAALAKYFSRRPNESVADFSKRVALFFTRIEGIGERTAMIFDRNVALQRMTLLAAALVLYHFDKKTFPNTLDAVLPYLPGKKIPLDPFTGKSFLYHPTSADGYVLYSAGDNGNDDDAHDATSTPKGDDIVIRIP